MKDPRYKTIQGLLKEGEIAKFTDIFKWIPYTVVANDFGTNHNRMKKMIVDPALWKLEELYQLADWIGYSRQKPEEMKKEDG